MRAGQAGSAHRCVCYDGDADVAELVVFVGTSAADERCAEKRILCPFSAFNAPLDSLVELLGSPNLLCSERWSLRMAHTRPLCIGADRSQQGSTDACEEQNLSHLAYSGEVVRYLFNNSTFR